MARIKSFFSNPWVIGFIGLTALSLIFWFGADYIKFGENNQTIAKSVRLIAIAFVFTLWLVWNISKWLFERRQNQALLSSIEETESTGNPDEERSKEDVAAIASRFQEAMTTLKKSRFKSARGSRSLYQLPWYIIIGPPGAGKTTALVNSGLDFPLAQSHGKGALGGIGGTRNCDWWFTNEAVLIDTAGRYTTQDSHRVIDNNSWNSFLNLLKKYRRRRPINGAIIAISLQDLMVQTAEQRVQLAKTIRSRINELQDQLGIRFPIYLNFTKCDLVSGFSEFFDNMSQAEREQVWGLSFPPEQNSATGANLDIFQSEYKQLIERLNQRALWRAHNERDIDKRASLQAFPARMSGLADILDDFIKQTFGSNRYNTVPMVRGIYFSSATQEGNPIDRMMAAVSANFGLDREMARQSLGGGKSFFISRLFNDVIFPEAELVGVNRKLESSMRWLRRLSFIGLTAGFAGTLFLWFGSLAQNTVFMGEVQENIQTYQEAKDKLPRKSSAQDTLSAMQPLYAATQVYNQEEHPWLSNLGLYDGSVDRAADNLYQEQLDTTFLPAVLVDIERQLSRYNSSDPELLDTLKVYLMFFSQDKRDNAAISQHLALYWEQTLQGKAAQQTQLAAHLSELLATELPEIEPNERVVARARQQLRRTPIPQRLYTQLQGSDYGVHQVSLYNEIGGDLEQAFGVQDNNPLFDMPYLYTKEGYKDQDFSANSTVMEQLAADRWIYGEDIEGEDFSEADRERIAQDLKRLYLADYNQRWQKFINSFHIAPFNSTKGAIEQLSQLADPVYSPLLAVVDLTVENTELTRKPQLPKGAQGVNAPIGGNTGRLADNLGSSIGDALADKYQPTIVDIRFEPLHRIAQSEQSRPARIQQYLTAIEQVQEFLLEIDNAPNSNEAAFQAAKVRFSGGSNDAIRQLRSKANKAPAPIKDWLNEIADNSWALVMSKTKRYVDSAWRQQVYSSYQQNLQGRYPLTADRGDETPVQEFNRFFQPGGIEQSFVKEYLSAFIDTRKWQRKTLEGQQLSLSSNTLKQIRRAENIRRAFFSNGEGAGFKFRIEPTKLDSGVRLFALELGDARVPYSHGPRTVKDLQWTGGEDNRARIIFEDLNESVHRKHFEGDWAWFRLLDASTIGETQRSNIQKITFEESGRKAQFNLIAANNIMPFDGSLLRNYRPSEQL